MTKANILPENDLYKWFNTTIYYFHVPLFFICSGYLYQKVQQGKQCGQLVQECGEKGIGTWRAVCDIYDSYMDTEKDVLKQC